MDDIYAYVFVCKSCNELHTIPYKSFYETKKDDFAIFIGCPYAKETHFDRYEGCELHVIRANKMIISSMMLIPLYYDKSRQKKLTNK